MTGGMEIAIREKVNKHIPVIDGVQAAIEMGIGLSRMRIRVKP